MGRDAERLIQETVARCVGIVVFFHDSGRCEANSRRMADEVRGVGRRIEEMGLGPDGIEHLILRPVSTELLARFGHELGPRLNAEFLASIDEQFPIGPGSRAEGPADDRHSPGR